MVADGAVVEVKGRDRVGVDVDVVCEAGVAAVAVVE